MLGAFSNFLSTLLHQLRPIRYFYRLQFLYNKISNGHNSYSTERLYNPIFIEQKLKLFNDTWFMQLQPRVPFHQKLL